MKKEFPCIEATFEFSDNGKGEFRVWIDEEKLPDVKDHKRLGHILIDLLDIAKEELSPADKMRAMAKIPHVSAVQHRLKVKDITMGVVIYTVDFN